VLDAAWEISIKHGVSVYDACYVALSDMTGAPLVTEDKRLCVRLKFTSHKLLSLAELEL
jgi:predicted nucleic acid-binding protein